MTKKIRFSAEKQTMNGETRYKVKDHTGQTYVDRVSYHPSMSSSWDDKAFFEEWRQQTCPTLEQAMADHAPLSWDDGEILAPDTRITRIDIETLSESKTVYHFYVLRDTMPTFLVNPKEIKFYGFETLSGTNEIFLYSDIKHICFKEV